MNQEVPAVNYDMFLSYCPITMTTVIMCQFFYFSLWAQGLNTVMVSAGNQTKPISNPFCVEIKTIICILNMLACSQSPQKSYFKECDWSTTIAAMFYNSFFSPCHSLPQSAGTTNSSCLSPWSSSQYRSTHLSLSWLRTYCLSSCLHCLQPAFQYLPLHHDRYSCWCVVSSLMWENERAARCFWFQPVEVWIAESTGYSVLPCPPAAVFLVCLSSDYGDTWLELNVTFLNSDK